MSGLGSTRATSRRRALLACLVVAGAALLALPAVAQQPVSPPTVESRDAIVRKLVPVTGESELTGRRHTPRTIDLDIRFALDSADLTPEARRQLDELGQAIISQSLSRLRFRIAGHTDASGSAQHNLALSAARAAAARDYLVVHFKVDPARLESAGFGEERLKDPAHPLAGVNRRVEITSIGWMTAVTKEAPAKESPAKEEAPKDGPPKDGPPKDEAAKPAPEPPATPDARGSQTITK